jgi:hypothetical protein
MHVEKIKVNKSARTVEEKLADETSVNKSIEIIMRHAGRTGR